MEENNYSSFRKSILKIHGNRNHKVKGSIGVYSAYKWLRKNKWLNISRPLTEHEFYSIIRRVNNYLADKLVNGEDVVFPERMGKLELRKKKAVVKFKDGKLITNRYIDWDSTLKLWYEDPEEYKNKTILYEENKELFRVIYNTTTAANYNNKAFYNFSINRDLKQRLNKKAKDGTLEAFLL